MALVAEAVYNAFLPTKLNYELLGVGNAVHMHWLIFPRTEGDTPDPGPVWKLDKTDMYSDQYRPSIYELDALKICLNTELEKVLKQ